MPRDANAPGMSDPLVPRAIVAVQAALVGTPFATVRYLAQTGSTNEDAAALLGEPAHAGLTIVADHQTRGAGRKGRTWVAPAGSSLLFTTILPEPLPASEIWIVPYWAALAVRAGLASHGVATDLHWPNDLLVGPRKIAGILCTSRVVGTHAYVACGVGINVTRPPGADEAISPPPAFCDDVAPVNAHELLVTILTQFASTVGGLESPQRIARLWEAAAGLPGKPYRLLLDREAVAFEANAIALATGGGLAIERDGRRETISLADARALR